MRTSKGGIHESIQTQFEPKRLDSRSSQISDWFRYHIRSHHCSDVRDLDVEALLRTEAGNAVLQVVLKTRPRTTGLVFRFAKNTGFIVKGAKRTLSA